MVCRFGQSYLEDGVGRTRIRHQEEKRYSLVEAITRIALEQLKLATGMKLVELKFNLP